MCTDDTMGLAEKLPGMLAGSEWCDWQFADKNALVLGRKLINVAELPLAYYWLLVVKQEPSEYMPMDVADLELEEPNAHTSGVRREF